MARVDMVHTGFRHGDTAALDRGERDLVLGDEVRCVPCPMPAAAGDGPPVAARQRGVHVGAPHGEIVRPGVSHGGIVHPGVPHAGVLPVGRWDASVVPAVTAGDGDTSGRPRAELDFAIRMSMGGYVAVAAGRITAWTDARDRGVPLFDSAGHPVARDEPEPEPEAPVPREVSGYGPPSRCAVCAAVRSGGVARMRAEHRADLDERRRVNDEAKAIRRREALRPLPSWRTPD